MKVPFTKSDIARAGNRIAHIDSQRFHARNDLKYTGHLDGSANNLKLFLDRFPNLIETQTSKFEGMKRLDWPNRIPVTDHTYYWRVKGVRGALIATTFPYGFNAVAHSPEMFQFALTHGMEYEIAPPDVPDFYYEGWTTPIIWYRAGRDWRALAKGGAK